VADKRVIEVGCGTGDNLLQLIQLGFEPANLAGNELLEERVAAARGRLPADVAIHPGDALELPVALGSFDVVYQSMVFTSLLDEGFRRALAARLWALAKPGGGVLWYDFTFNNPRNPDVRGIPLRGVRGLFPEAEMTSWRLTLAPPLAKRVTALHPGLYGWANSLPFLRTHVLCWLRKRG
jgi:SAM-dependent methyltransferase